MRMLMKVNLDTATGNNAVRNGTLGSTIKSILDEIKPEAAYFIAEGGKRTGLLIIHMDDASQIPSFAEPWFLALNASVECVPAMVPADLQKAAPDIERAVKMQG